MESLIEASQDPSQDWHAVCHAFSCCLSRCWRHCDAISVRCSRCNGKAIWLSAYGLRLRAPANNTRSGLQLTPTATVTASLSELGMAESESVSEIRAPMEAHAGVSVPVQPEAVTARHCPRALVSTLPSYSSDCIHGVLRVLRTRAVSGAAGYY